MWKNYGQKIISSLFKKWTDSTAVRVELESKVQADSDRSDIRMFEAGLPNEQYGDYEQSTRVAAQEAEGARLIAIAKANGTFIAKSEWSKFGDRKRLISGESIVYLDERENVVTKIRNPFAKAIIKGLHAPDIIFEHLVHNILFPNTRYKFVGISEDFSGIRIILQQEYFSDKYITPTQRSIDAYLIKGLGLRVENRYFYSNDYIAITDVSADGDNVLSDGEHLYFIDPIIKFKRPAVDVIEYYNQSLR